MRTTAKDDIAKPIRISRSLAGIVCASCVLLALVHVRAQRFEGDGRGPVSRYGVIDLGKLPDRTFSPFSQATFVNANGMVTGLAAVADGTQHAVVWYKRQIFDIAPPNLAGRNSGAF